MLTGRFFFTFYTWRTFARTNLNRIHNQLPQHELFIETTKDGHFQQIYTL